MPKFGLITCFSPVTVTDVGEHKFEDKNWELENGKNWGFGDPKSS